MKNILKIFTYLFKAFRLDPDNVLVRQAYVRESFRRHRYKHNIRMVMFFSLVLLFIEPLSIFIFHGTEVFDILINEEAVYRRNLLILQLSLTFLPFSYITFLFFTRWVFKEISLSIRHHVSMFFMVLGYFALTWISINAQLFHGSIVIASIALYCAGIIFYFNLFFQILIFLVNGILFIFMIGVFQQDAVIAKMNQANFFIITIVSWLVAVYFQKYRLKNYLNYFQLREKDTEEQKDLELARKIQKGLLPLTTSGLNNFSINYIYEPLEQVGGDLVDFIKFKEPNLYGIFICDVAGHGVSAAMVSSMIKTLIMSMNEKKFSPADFLIELNLRSRELTKDFIFSAFYGLLDDRDRTMKYARAGHCYPIHFSGEDIVELKGKGHILGFNDEVVIEEETIVFENNDSLLLFTDGFIEEENPARESFDICFRKKLKEKQVRRNKQIDSSDLLKMLRVFKQGEPFKDDVSIIAVNIG